MLPEFDVESLLRGFMSREMGDDRTHLWVDERELQRLTRKRMRRKKEQVAIETQKQLVARSLAFQARMAALNTRSAVQGEQADRGIL